MRMREGSGGGAGGRSEMGLLLCGLRQGMRALRCNRGTAAAWPTPPRPAGALTMLGCRSAAIVLASCRGQHGRCMASRVAVQTTPSTPVVHRRRRLPRICAAAPTAQPVPAHLLQRLHDGGAQAQHAIVALHRRRLVGTHQQLDSTGRLLECRQVHLQAARGQGRRSRGGGQQRLSRGALCPTRLGPCSSCRQAGRTGQRGVRHGSGAAAHRSVAARPQRPHKLQG